MKKSKELQYFARTEKNSTPTQELHKALQQAYEYFNIHLFESTLPNCILNFSRKRNAMGFFFAESWKQDNLVQHEISLNPDWLQVSPIEIMSVLVHEQGHLWQYCFGKPSKGNYHNLEFARKMFQIGLVCSKTGKPGGKPTGVGMSHYIKEGGAFEKAFNKMPQEYLLPWINSHQKEKSREEEKKDSKGKTCYTCPSCMLKVWGKTDLSIYCGDCKHKLI